MRNIIQKLKIPLLVAAYVSLFMFSGLFTGTSLAASPCPPAKAPTGTNCAKLPLGCPGSTVQGPVAQITLPCKYGPANGSTYACPAKKCTFKDHTHTLTTGQGVDSNGGVSANPRAATSGGLPGGDDCSTGLDSCGLVQTYLNPFIKFLSAFVGLAVVISVIIGGIQFGSSAGDPQKAAAAIARIRNSVLALITYVFLLAMLNFLVPGGLK